MEKWFDNAGVFCIQVFWWVYEPIRGSQPYACGHFDALGLDFGFA
jgi:hypothetical protein